MKSHLLAGLLLLGVLLLVGCDKAPPSADPPTANPSSTETETSDPKVADLSKRAAKGDAQSQYELGNYFRRNEELPDSIPTPGATQSAIDKFRKDYAEQQVNDKAATKALGWYQKAAAQGHPGAQFKLGEMYFNGDGVGKDEAKAVEWYQKAAAQENADAQYELGRLAHFAPPHEHRQIVDPPPVDCILSGDGPKSTAGAEVAWYQKAAANGHSTAQFDLGCYFYYGDGFPKNTGEAAEWFRKAAANGHSTAQFNLGWMYANGEGVPKDASEAIEWYSKAAAQGDARAQFKVGFMYANGEGVAKDAAMAVKWYQDAAKQGSVGAQNNLGLLYSNGEGVPKDAARAAELFQKAAVQGGAYAQSNLALSYYNGKGVPEDKVLAYAWWNLAASKSNKSALELRAIVEAQLSTAELAEAQRLSSSWKAGQTLAREGRSLSASAASAATPGKLSKKGTGTLFLVSATGQAITNHHVVAGCSEIRIEGRDGVAKVVTEDVVNDLALVQIPGEAKSPAAMTSDAGKLRQGDDIVVYGFPLDTLLSSGGNLTPGVVSALTGLGNNTNQIQITAPIQPGSSGSPVLNKKGEVVGVVSMKLSDSAMAKATGQVGQNVNFAINGQTLRTFLDAHQVSYRSGAGFFSREKSMADLADEARTWTLVAECWK